MASSRRLKMRRQLLVDRLLHQQLLVDQALENLAAGRLGLLRIRHIGTLHDLIDLMHRNFTAVNLCGNLGRRLLFAALAAAGSQDGCSDDGQGDGTACVMWHVFPE